MGNVWLAQNNHLIKWKLSEFLADGKNQEIDISPDRLNLDYNNGFGYTYLMTDRVAYFGPVPPVLGLSK